MKYNVDIRKEKEPLICGNNEIINILDVELKKSLKHREKIKILKGMDNVNLTKVNYIFYCMQSKKKKCDLKLNHLFIGYYFFLKIKESDNVEYVSR
jgi:hypothetical protein